MPYAPVLATLGYIFSPDGTRVLLCHRNARPADRHFGKWNGIGGKLEADEDVLSGFRREVREETGLECTSLHLAGTISWPGFGKNGEAWFGFLFRVTAVEGTPFGSNEEGDLHWIPLADVPTLPMWDGDRHFLPMVLDRAAPQFHGIMPYSNGRAAGWICTLCE